MTHLIELFTTNLICIHAPTTPLNCQLDGGHLVAAPRRHIADRVQCSAREAVELMAASMLAAKAMLEILKVEKINYQEMGNWSLDTPKTAKLHIHIFGRHSHQRYQQRGESIRFYPANHPIYKQVYQPHTKEQIIALTHAMQTLSKQPPFTQLFVPAL